MPTKKTPAQKKSAPPPKKASAPKKAATTKKAPAPKKTSAPKKATTTQKKATKPSVAADPELGAQLERRFADIGGWRGPLLSTLRAAIRAADPELVEERKWVKPSNQHGVPTYSRAGLVLTLEVYQAAVKITFAQGSKVNDPAGLFNASLLGLRRAIDFHEGDAVNLKALQALVRAAVAVNLEKRGA